MPQQIHVEDRQFHKQFRAGSNIEQHRSKQCYTIHKSDHILILLYFPSLLLYDDDWNWNRNLIDYGIIILIILIFICKFFWGD